MFNRKNLLRIPSDYNHKWGQGNHSTPGNENNNAIRSSNKNIRIIFKKFFLLKTEAQKMANIVNNVTTPISGWSNTRRMNRKFYQLLGGSYCSQCGGPCGNHNHSIRF